MFRILGCYRPHKYTLDTIGRDLLSFTEDAGLVGIKEPKGISLPSGWATGRLRQAESYAHSMDVRSPAWHELQLDAVERDPEIYRWHQDWHRQGNDGELLPRSLVLWSNETPTEFLMPDGEIVQPKPFEIVLADNMRVKHRTPAVLGKRRWFFR